MFMRKFMEYYFGGKRNRKNAENIRKRLSMIYALVGWNCFGLGIYLVLKDKMPNSNPTERRMGYKQLIGVPDNMHVYKISGFTITEDFDVAYRAKLAQEELEAGKKEKTTTNMVEH